MACGIHGSGARTIPDGDSSGAIVKMSGDGFVSIYKSSADVGTWSNTAIAQIVAEELRVGMDKIEFHRRANSRCALAIAESSGRTARSARFCAQRPC